MTWQPSALIEMVCKVCKKNIPLNEKMTVCTFKETKWIRCEQCQAKAETITQGSILVKFNPKTKPMQKFSKQDFERAMK